jgi:hypothetical protein
MTYFPDLVPYDYLPDTVPEGVALLTVGWLEPGREFPTADADPDPVFWQNLVTLAADHTVATTRSVHGCRFRHLFEATSTAPSTARASCISAAPRSASSPPTGGS